MKTLIAISLLFVCGCAYVKHGETVYLRWGDQSIKGHVDPNGAFHFEQRAKGELTLDAFMAGYGVGLKAGGGE